MEQTHNEAVRQETSTTDLKRRIFLDVGLWGCLTEAHGPENIIKKSLIFGPFMGLPVAEVLVLHDLLRDPGRPLTSFGAVCGNYVILGDWLGRALGGFWGGFGLFDSHDRSGKLVELPEEWKESFKEKMPDKLSSFFTEVQDLKMPDNKPRGYVLNAAYSPVSLTSPDKPLIILPDLHLPLYKGTVLDRFRYKKRDNSDELVSLEIELKFLLHFAKKHDFTTVQAGDMYEVWESEILLREQLIGLFLLRQKLLNSNSAEWYGEVHKQLNNILAEGKFLPDPKLDFDYVGRIEELKKEDSPLRKILSHSSKEGIEFSKTDSILNGIRKQYDEHLFKGKDKLCDLEVRGNHDNRLKNDFWLQFGEGDKDVLGVSQIEVEDFRKRAMVPTVAAETGHVPTHIITGEENSISIEHGHIYDWHNADALWVKDALNDRNWELNDRNWLEGFKVVVFKAAGKLLAIIPRFPNGIRLRSIQELAIKAGGEISDWGEFEMRYPEFKRTDQIFMGIPTVRLVIMGHTHMPMVWVSNSCDFFSTYDDSQLSKHIVGEYEDSRYWRDVFETYKRREDHMRDRYMVLE